MWEVLLQIRVSVLNGDEEGCFRGGIRPSSSRAVRVWRRMPRIWLLSVPAASHSALLITMSVPTRVS